ncbi:MAG: hypothetical protein EXX96DRAFT_586971 [Benjaminiella poitrasii]|nr:MAG: hypothetical protein EXX96DRAFT_586971 [Benjaminiella poitrasii]
MDDDTPSPIYDKPNAYDTIYNTLPQEVIDDLIVRPHFINGKLPDVKTNDDDDNIITSSVLSHHSSSTTTIISVTTTAVSTSSSSSTFAASSSQHLSTLLHHSLSPDILRYDIRKSSLSKPHEHDVYLDNDLIYRKRQTHAYSWGFQNILYNNGYVKLAESKRRAFSKDITIEWYSNQKEITSDNTAVMLTSSPLYHKETYVYETQYGDSRLRWKRPSVLSHDWICQMEHDGKWRQIAVFDSHRLGHVMLLGDLTIDKRFVNECLEALLILTCCTLIDLT